MIRRPAASVAGIVVALVAGSLFASSRLQGVWGVAYAPAVASPSGQPGPVPVILYLHGMWASPEDSCAYFERGSTPFGFLVCPRGNAPLGDGRMWAGTYATVAPSVRAALRAAEMLAPGKLARSGGTLIGYSNGAYFASEIARAEPGRWTGLVLLSMRLDLDPAGLRAAGIRRVVLAAGEKDGAWASMRALAERTEAAGVPCRFMSLGPGGHEFPRDIGDRMCVAIAWVRGSERVDCGSVATSAAPEPADARR
jgi:predicted esterase